MNAPLRSSNKDGFALSQNRKEAATRGSRRLLPALLALGGTCGFVCGPASALELGPIDVHSTLGQPLRASISYALNPREAIGDYCIYLRPGRTASGLPSIDRATIVLSKGSILLTGREALREPMLSLQLAVDCPGAAQLTREYSILLSPWMPSTQAAPGAVMPTTSMDAEPAAAVPTPSSQVKPAAAVSAAATSRRNTDSVEPAATDRIVNRAPIAGALTYRVQQGDTLSGVAQRISDRTIGIWQAVDLIFAANPGAFVDNNRDLLKAGSLLRIPGSLTDAHVNQSTAPPIRAQAAPALEPATDQSSSGTAHSASASEAEASGSSDETPPVKMDDTALESAGPFVSPIETADGPRADAASFAPAVEVIPETAIEQPATGQSATTDRNDHAANDSGSWWVWLGGTGVALILGLFLFGRTLRNRFGGNADPLADVPELNRGKTDARAENDGARDTAAGSDLDFSFGEAAMDGHAMPLDGDLDAGTGFHDGGEIDVAQDFGFSASDDLRLGLDLELSDEPAVRLEDGETAMLAAGQRPEESIIVDEVRPAEDASGDYDISTFESTIVDTFESTTINATRLPLGNSDETTRDVQALELDANDTAGADDDSYTLNQEVDYRILEQDYEDELTATQALNAELAQAARELRADVNESEARRNPEDSVNEEMTAEMPAAENDATAALDIESATLDTKKPKAKKTGT